MRRTRLYGPRFVGLLLGTVLLAARPALASPVYSGTIGAVFSDPLLVGNILDEGGNPVFEDHTATAAFSIINGGSTPELISGDNFNGNGHPTEIIFFGSTFSGVAPDEEFELGTLTFNNGTSTIGTSIFGATLTLSVIGDPSVTVASTVFSLLTTRNGGFSPTLDADFLNFPPPLAVNFHVYEGAGATAKVFGRIVGDPVLELTQVQLDANQAGGGFLEPVPEPATLTLFGVGVLGLLGARRRRLS